MSIYKLNSGLSSTTKVELLNDMILELEGLVEQGKFDTNELDELFSKIYQRKYLREQNLGSTVATYPGWEHFSAQTGYSIWKYTPANYVYNANNIVYFDDKVLENRGEAAYEPITAFTKVFLGENVSGGGAAYTDHTTEAGTAGGTQFDLISDTDDYLYVGSSSTFGGIDFKFYNRGSGYDLKVEYYSDVSGTGWSELTSYEDSLAENTSDFISNGTILFDIPSDWELATVNSQSLYWVRISTSDIPTTVASAYSVLPTSSVVASLGLSSTQISNGDWAWCTFGTDIYVTIRNAGMAAYEGNVFITSTSTSTNLQSFFVYNHVFKIDHENSNYTSGLFLVSPDSAPADAALGNGQVSFWLDESGNNLTVKAKYSSGTVKSGTVPLT